MIPNNSKKIQICFLLAAQLLVLFSCALYIDIDRDKQLDNISHKKDAKKTGNNKSYYEFVLSGHDHQDSVSRPIEKIKKLKLGFIEKAVLFSLLNMNLNPHLVTPSSNLYILINYKEQKYFSFSMDSSHDNSKHEHWPFLYGLESILKQYSSRYSLENLASMLDKHLPMNIPIGSSLATYIDSHAEQLNKYPIFKKNFFKAEHPIRKGESIHKLNFTNIIRQYRKIKKTVKNNTPTINSRMFPYSPANISSKNISIKCNHDFNPYQKSIYLISQKERQNLPFGHQDKNGNSFLAITTHNIDTPKPLKNSFLIQGTSESNKDSLALCFVNNNSRKSQISIISTKGRDPGQYLHHLILYGIQDTRTLLELDEFIRFPRHLFLLNPVRMIYESSRGTKKQLDKFLAMNFPIYHGHSLGNIWAHASFHDKNISGFVVDERTPACLE